MSSSTGKAPRKGSFAFHNPWSMQKIETFVQASQHAERKAIDLEQLHFLQIILVPLDDRAIGHRRVLDRHEMVQRLLGDHEAADMLRKMTRKSVDLAGQREKA